MLRSTSTLHVRFGHFFRGFHASTLFSSQTKQAARPPPTTRNPLQKPVNSPRKVEKTVKQDSQEVVSTRRVKRNELGVQLLSRKLHEQVFKNVSFPRPDPAYINIAREHLQQHDLDTTQGSVLPDIGFTLPPLQGQNIAEHFHRIGRQTAHPWLSLVQSFAQHDLPPKPDHWHIQSGWTKYHYLPDGSSYSEHVSYPSCDGTIPEDMLSFDVETMPNYHPYAIMACAASKDAWYAWISPWLLGETSNPEQLIPLGDPSVPKVVVGHNVSYDRARVLEEYSVEGTKNRFIDTMAFHIAVKGISSHQRPAWMKHRKSKEKEKERQVEAIEAAFQRLEDLELQQIDEPNEEKKANLARLRADMEQSLAQAGGLEGLRADVDIEEAVSKRWEDLTSANSLADVAKLHCDIDVEKEIRDDFMKLTPTEIRDSISDYLDYCATDVDITHRVFKKVLPDFFKACPHPVSFAGVLTMGSSFLTVNQEWERYLEQAEASYREMEVGVQAKLRSLAEDARRLFDEPGEKWRDDEWLSQLDWSPKVVGKSRGVFPYPVQTTETVPTAQEVAITPNLPAWYAQLSTNPFETKSFERIIPLLLKLSYDGRPLLYNYKERWHYIVDGEVTRLPSANGKKTTQVLCTRHALAALNDEKLGSIDPGLVRALSQGRRDAETRNRILTIAQDYLSVKRAVFQDDPWLQQLDWTQPQDSVGLLKPKRVSKPQISKPPSVLWPKWYWDATKPKKDAAPGTLDVTVRSRIAPLLLQLSWLGWPLVHSREHGWTFRVPSNAKFETRSTALTFFDPADDTLADMTLRGGYVFYKLPHKDGDKANVGNPLGKTFMKFAQDGTLKSPSSEAKEALDLNAQCSYWISARDRILNQLVRWQNDQHDLGFRANSDGTKWGIILPQVITMGTVTRRAIEKTWLTASNAKKNRVGSELKAMVRAPEGYAIVGADVDSEELWISSCMGDAQFGLHGATAIGWMTLEGTKAAGTDLHSKTASILGISRNQAKVFNYSRIYGAGMRHAVLLLLQSNAGMLPDEAQKLAENLYMSTKGKNTHRSEAFGRKFWFGGTESYLFNKLEEIALSDLPQTPALGCGVTHALSKDYLPKEFGSDYMPSRINWVVQSSGVDYLHLLIVSMNHLIDKYNINARYLISVHDELRYLVADDDRYRAALALQIANLWTRSMFAYKLGMDDLPQGVAFFSAVDVDRVLRKEVDMPCVTPSQPIPIPPGESLEIQGILNKTHGGSLLRDGQPMGSDEPPATHDNLEGYFLPDCMTHRAHNAAFLRAQATTDLGEVLGLARYNTGSSGTVGATAKARSRKTKKTAPIGNGEGFDWSETMERLRTMGR